MRAELGHGQGREMQTNLHHTEPITEAWPYREYYSGQKGDRGGRQPPPTDWSRHIVCCPCPAFVGMIS